MNSIRIHKNDKRLKSFDIDENIFNQIEKENGNILCVAEIDLLISSNPYFYNWLKYADGTLCLIKNLNKNEYFFKLFNSIALLLWEHQIKSNKIYIKLNENFYYFTTQDFNFGFKFSSLEQAVTLFETVNNLVIMQKRKEINFTNSISNRLLKKTPAKKKTSLTNAISLFNRHNNEKHVKTELLEDLLQRLEIKSNKKRCDYLKQFIAKNGGLDYINKELDTYTSMLFYDNYFNLKNMNIDKKNSDSLNNLLDISIDSYKTTTTANNELNTTNEFDLLQLNDLNIDIDSVSVQNFAEQSEIDFKHFNSNDIHLKPNNFKNVRDLSIIDKLKVDLLALSDPETYESDTE